MIPLSGQYRFVVVFVHIAHDIEVDIVFSKYVMQLFLNAAVIDIVKIKIVLRDRQVQ